MPRIEFRGKMYNSEFEMPSDIRQAYNKEKERKNKTGSKSLTEVVDMSPEVKAIYERALGKIDEKLAASRPLDDLPKTEDIYRQSAPDDMKDLPSDESIYRPSEPLIQSTKPAIEPVPGLGMNRIVANLIWVLIVAAVIFFIIRFLL